jgi:hypothetical protein
MSPPGRASPAPSAPPGGSLPRRSARRPTWLVVVVIGLGLGGLELALRGLGLGHPPLLVADRQMEYRFRPNQNLLRFSHSIQINRWGMRSPALPPRPSPGTRRLLVLGDSITWGGAETGQDRIAVSRLQRQLGPGWELLNLGTPSWGPANWLGAVRHFGLFAAPQVLLVVSSHDADDAPSYAPLEGSPETPTQDPPLAVIELWQRYLAPRLMLLVPGAAQPQAALSPNLASPHSPNAPGAASGQRPPELLAPLPSLASLLRAVRSQGAQLVVLQHWERGEIETGRPYPNHDRIAALLRLQGVPTTQAGPIMARCAASHGQPVAALFVDSVHPYTDLGQRCLAEALRQALTPLSPPPVAAPPRP